MNGLSPEGASLDAAGDADPVAARTSVREPAQGESDREAGRATTGEHEASAEVAQLESLLDARSRELQEQRAEAARIRNLLRDAVERFDTSVAAAAEQIAVDLRRERDQAVARALESEAARADIRFRLDEVMGHLAAAGAAETAQSGERLDVTCARLAGTVRGLLSALAESQEGREVSQARLMLAEQDLADVRAIARALEREQAEARDQIELEQMKVQRLTDQFRGGLPAQAAGVLRGERDGERARGAEAELALASVLSRIGELEQTVARETESRGEAGSALAAAQAERIVLLEELTRMRAALAASDADRSRAQQVVAEQLEATRSGAIDSRVRAARDLDALREAREQWNDLAGMLRAVLQRSGGGQFDPRAGGEDATQPGVPTYIEAVEGLEVQLAASEERVRQLEARIASAAAALRELEVSTTTPVVGTQLAGLRALLERR